MQPAKTDLDINGLAKHWKEKTLRLLH